MFWEKRGKERIVQMSKLAIISFCFDFLMTGLSCRVGVSIEYKLNSLRTCSIFYRIINQCIRKLRTYVESHSVKLQGTSHLRYGLIERHYISVFGARECTHLTFQF